MSQKTSYQASRAYGANMQYYILFNTDHDILAWSASPVGEFKQHFFSAVTVRKFCARKPYECVKQHRM